MLTVTTKYTIVSYIYICVCVGYSTHGPPNNKEPNTPDTEEAAADLDPNWSMSKRRGQQVLRFRMSVETDERRTGDGTINIHG